LDPDSVLAQIRSLGSIGADPAGGRTRITLTDDEKSGRDQLVRWMRELDLDVQVDRIGNIFGILHAAHADGDARPLMIGSHIDTVRNAGALDGCYGVLAGLAVVRAFRASGTPPARAIVVGAFTNEEGVRYQPDMMGSLVYACGLPLDEALDTVGTDGTRLGNELERIGYAGTMEPGAIVPQEYIELHIEQGPVLEAEGQLIGVVEDLQGISWQKVTVHGTANHAGTTPTRLRHDAGYVASAVVAFLREHVRLLAAEERLAEFLVTIAEREGVRIETERLVRFQPVKFDADLANEIEASARRFGFTHRRMTSGAGHDAQMIARIAPSAMIFVPSQGGISHNPREHTDDAQLVQGAQVLLDVVQRRLAAA
jgi:N-carbamoyl-L-amino-acid hydrolase